MKHSHIVRTSEGISPFPVFSSASLIKPAPEHPADGREAFAFIRGKVVVVVWSEAFGSYIEPRFSRYESLITAAV